MTTLQIGQLSDFEDYFDVKKGKSDIYWMGFCTEPPRDKLYQCFMERTIREEIDQNNPKVIYMIKADGVNVGYIQVSLIGEEVEIGYSVREQCQGKGYGTEAIRLLIKNIVGGGRTVFARVRDDNIPSIKCFLKNGFIRTEQYELVEYPLAGRQRFRRYEMPPHQ